VSTCVAGEFSEPGGCIDPDECRDRDQELQACGINNRGNKLRNCDDGRWTQFDQCVDPDECLFGAMRNAPCGLNLRGRGFEACPAGRWIDAGDCVDIDVCVDGTTQPRICTGVVVDGRSLCQSGQWVDLPCPF
jgi:hypothetical protein